MGWLDGALRIMPSWEWVGLGPHHPARGLPAGGDLPRASSSTSSSSGPSSSRRYTKDLAYHNLLDRPRDRPKRTGAGAAMLTLLGMIFFASSTDVMANFFQLPLNDGALVLPVRRDRRADHRLLRDLQDLSTRCGPPRASASASGRCRDRGRRPASTRRSSPSPGPGDGHEELDAIPVPTYIDLVPPELATGAGVRRVMR